MRRKDSRNGVLGACPLFPREPPSEQEPAIFGIERSAVRLITRFAVPPQTENEMILVEPATGSGFPADTGRSKRC